MPAIPPTISNAPPETAVENLPPVPADTPYPRLGDVPSKPKDFTPQTDIDYIKRSMEEDRAQGEALRQQYEPSGGTDAQ